MNTPPTPTAQLLALSAMVLAILSLIVAGLLGGKFWVIGLMAWYAFLGLVLSLYIARR